MTTRTLYVETNNGDPIAGPFPEDASGRAEAYAAVAAAREAEPALGAVVRAVSDGPPARTGRQIELAEQRFRVAGYLRGGKYGTAR